MQRRKSYSTPLLLIIVLLQSTLPGSGVAHAAGRTPASSTRPALTAAPLAQSDDETEPDVEIAPPPAETPDAPPESLPIPLFLSLHSDQHVLHPGERAQLTINAWRASEEAIGGQQLTLTLPPAVTVLSDTLATTWMLPALAANEIFSRQVTIGPAGDLVNPAVVHVTLATTATTDFAPYAVDLVLGIDPNDATAASTAVAEEPLNDQEVEPERREPHRLARRRQ